MLIFWVTGPHTGRIVTQWRYCKQSKGWRGQTYPQPLLLCSEISLFWRTSCARDFFFLFFKPLDFLYFSWNAAAPSRLFRPGKSPANLPDQSTCVWTAFVSTNLLFFLLSTFYNSSCPAKLVYFVLLFVFAPLILQSYSYSTTSKTQKILITQKIHQKLITQWKNVLFFTSKILKKFLIN